MKELEEKAASGDVKAKAELKRMQGEDPAAHVSTACVGFDCSNTPTHTCVNIYIYIYIHTYIYIFTHTQAEYLFHRRLCRSLHDIVYLYMYS